MNQPRIFEHELSYTEGYRKGELDTAQSILRFLDNCQGYSYKERLMIIEESMKDLVKALNIRKESEKHVW